MTHREKVTKKGVHTTLLTKKEGTHTLMSYVDQARDQYSIAKAELVTGR